MKLFKLPVKISQKRANTVIKQFEVKFKVCMEHVQWLSTGAVTGLAKNKCRGVWITRRKGTKRNWPELTCFKTLCILSFFQVCVLCLHFVKDTEWNSLNQALLFPKGLNYIWIKFLGIKQQKIFNFIYIPKNACVFFYIYIFLRIIHPFTGSGEHSPLAIDGLNGHFAWLASIFNRLSQQNQGSDCVSVPPIRSCKAKTSCGPKFMTLTYSSNGLKAMLKMALLTELALMPLWEVTAAIGYQWKTTEETGTVTLCFSSCAMLCIFVVFFCNLS